MAQEVFGVVGCISAFCFGCTAIPGWIQAYQRTMASVYVQRQLHASTTTSIMTMRQQIQELCSYFIRNGVMWAMPAAERLCERSYVRNQMEIALRVVQASGQDSTSERLCSCVVAVCGLTCLFLLIITRSLVAGILGIALVLWAGQMALTHAEAKREEKLRLQVPDAMRSLCSCFQAGYSIPQAFMATSEESASPTRELFSRVARDIEVGRPVGDALRIFKDASGIPELGFAAVALDIQHITGGSVVPVLEAAEQSATRSLEMRRFLRTQTAQARFSAQIVSGLPIVLLMLLSIASPGFMNPFIESFQGMMLAVLAISLQVVGICWIKRLLATEVD